MKFQSTFLISLLLIFSFPLQAQEKICFDWFKDAKTTRDAADCEIKCTTLITDMNTFQCPSQCDKICQNPCKNAENFWKQKIKSDVPQKWPNPTEQNKVWTENEKKQVKDALMKLSPGFQLSCLDGIYRMDKSKDAGIPSSSLKTGSIALYDRAFTTSYTLKALLAHEMAHLIYSKFNEEQKVDYNMVSRWSLPRGSDRVTFHRSDNEFVRDPAMNSPEEDFAVNLETYATNPARLKSVCSPIYSWFERNFGDKFKAGKGCGK